MKMNLKAKKYFACFCVSLVGLSCTNTSDKTNLEPVLIDQRQAYYERIPDAPLDLYCHIDDLLDSESRKEICLSLMFNNNKNLSVDMGFVIKDGQLDTVEIHTMYFDKEGMPQKDSLNFEHLKKLVNSIDIEQVATLKNLTNADFALRLQVERFCIGFIQVNEPEIMSLVDSLRKKGNK